MQKSKPKRRRTLETKNPIIVTERAAERIKELLAGENAEGAIGIILGVKRRKC
jgi:Fe-S cluster assembly iron-binding protein IscA